jgi:hypothetical protein
MKIVHEPEHFNYQTLLHIEKMYFKLLAESLSNTHYEHLGQRLGSPAWGDQHYSGIGLSGLQSLCCICMDVIETGVVGDFLEAGVWRGGASIYMASIIKWYNANRRVWVCDSFEGMPPINKACPHEVTDYSEFTGLAVPVEAVAKAFALYDVLEYATFIKGWFADTIPNLRPNPLAVLRLDSDYYESTKILLDKLYPQLSVGGWCIVDDYDCVPGCNKAVDDYIAEHNIEGPFYRMNKEVNDLGVGIYWKKVEHAT